MMRWAYELSHAELLREFMNVCGEAGLGASGLVVDVMAGHHLSEAHYFRGVILSRLEGAGMPPFRPRDRVRSKRGEIRPLSSDWWGGHIPPETTVVITRIHYLNNLGVTWCLTFPDTMVEERGVPRYNADEFELVPAETASPAAS